MSINKYLTDFSYIYKKYTIKVAKTHVNFNLNIQDTMLNKSFGNTNIITNKYSKEHFKLELQRILTKHLLDNKQYIEYNKNKKYITIFVCDNILNKSLDLQRYTAQRFKERQKLSKLIPLDAKDNYKQTPKSKCDSLNYNIDNDCYDRNSIAYITDPTCNVENTLNHTNLNYLERNSSIIRKSAHLKSNLIKEKSYKELNQKQGLDGLYKQYIKEKHFDEQDIDDNDKIALISDYKNNIKYIQEEILDRNKEITVSLKNHYSKFISFFTNDLIDKKSVFKDYLTQDRIRNYNLNVSNKYDNLIIKNSPLSLSPISHKKTKANYNKRFINNIALSAKKTNLYNTIKSNYNNSVKYSNNVKFVENNNLKVSSVIPRKETDLIDNISLFINTQKNEDSYSEENIILNKSKEKNTNKNKFNKNNNYLYNINIKNYLNKIDLKQLCSTNNTSNSNKMKLLNNIQKRININDDKINNNHISSLMRLKIGLNANLDAETICNLFKKKKELQEEKKKTFEKLNKYKRNKKSNKFILNSDIDDVKLDLYKLKKQV